MFKKSWLKKLTAFVCAILLMLPVQIGNAEEPGTVYTFDLRTFLAGREDKVAYDYLKLATALQGLVNRETPQLYFFYESNPLANDSGMDMDQYWFSKLREPGNYLADVTVVSETDFFALLTRFAGYYEGLVIWDEDVPATSNVASTVAGADDLLPVRYDPAVGSVYSELIARNIPVQVNLAGKFTGQGTIPDTGLSSTGSAKNDAYLWAKAHYLDTGKTNPALMEYALDGTSWHNQIGENNSHVQSLSLPDTMGAGEVVESAITFINTGTTTWDKNGLVRLGSVLTGAGSKNQFVWSSASGGVFGDPTNQRVFMDEGEQIAPGDSKTFRFTLTAPDQPGKYVFAARMVRDGVAWMGDFVYKTIEVTTEVPDSYNASLVSYDIPREIVAGQRTIISLTLENTGTITWSKTTLDQLRSTGTDDGDNNDFVWDSDAGGSFGDPANQRVFMDDGEVVASGGRKTFELELIAPQTPGEYTFRARMVRDGTGWMGNPLKLMIRVSAATEHHASLVTYVIPQEMAAGQLL